MAHVLIVHDSESAREDLTRALSAEGFTCAQADCASAAVREIWQGTFDAAVVQERLGGGDGAALEDQLRSLAPEIVTVPVAREPAAKIARRVLELLEGPAVAA